MKKEVRLDVEMNYLIIRAENKIKSLLEEEISLFLPPHISRCLLQFSYGNLIFFRFHRITGKHIHVV